MTDGERTECSAWMECAGCALFHGGMFSGKIFWELDFAGGENPITRWASSTWRATGMCATAGPAGFALRGGQRSFAHAIECVLDWAIRATPRERPRAFIAGRGLRRTSTDAERK